MRSLITDFMMPAEAALIRADAAALVADIEVRVVVTYREFGTVVYDPRTGTQTPTQTDYLVGAIRSIVSEREVQVSNGLYQTGDVKYTFDRASLTITPSNEDLILDGADTYKVKDWNTDPLAALWNVVARRVS